MNARIFEQIKALVRAYWQHTALGLLALLVLFQLSSWGMTYIDLMKIDSRIAEAKTPGESEDAKEENQSGSNKNNEERKPEKNIFKKEEISYRLTAIYMDTAVIENKDVKVGDRVGKAEVKEIGLDYVVIQEDGKENTRRLELFEQSGGRPADRGGGPSPSRMRRGPERSRGEIPRREEPGPGQASPPEESNGNDRDDMAFKGRSFDELRNMNPSERREFFQNLTPDEREELRSMARRMRD